MIDGLWRVFPQGCRFDIYKWSSAREEFRLRNTRLTGANLLDAAKREVRNMGQNSSRLLAAHYTTPEVNHRGQVIGPPESIVVNQQGQVAEPADNVGCEYCGRWYPPSPFPFPNCRFCGAAPAYHHGRCCLSRPSDEDVRAPPQQEIQRTVFMAVKTRSPTPPASI